nr:regulatory protein GemA [uncultured Albidiferax sp.]
MSKLARDHRNAELAQIHIGVAALQWTDDDYRVILHSKTGHSSAGKLDAAGRRAFLDHLRACGWKPAKKAFTQADKIQYFWEQLVAAGGVKDGSKAALMAFVGRTAGMAVSDLKFLPVQKASTVIEALKSWSNRCKAKKEAAQ